MKICSRLGKAILATMVIMLCIATGVVIGSYLFEDTVGVSLEIVPTGEISVTPASLNLGVVHRGDVVDCGEVSVLNDSEASLTIQFDSQLVDAGEVLADVSWITPGTVLASGDAATANLTLTISGSTTAWGVHPGVVWNVAGTSS